MSILRTVCIRALAQQSSSRSLLISQRTFANSNPNPNTVGIKDKVVGTVKENLGKVIGNETMQQEGREVRTHGDNSGSSKTAEKATAVKDQVVGSVKETVGNVTGDEKMKRDGKKQQK
eukprot:TRINITY_DN14711_c0_g1_i1.p1 TRINITY_DN14711_c0_g1~~TRINITY_DN14711_c0_g1_i1.p1  ORF type:complete len:125 (-),score=34.61 TRINITY_DN14711_c0_g1_i1:70-423(-)